MDDMPLPSPVIIPVKVGLSIGLLVGMIISSVCVRRELSDKYEPRSLVFDSSDDTRASLLVAKVSRLEVRAEFCSSQFSTLVNLRLLSVSATALNEIRAELSMRRVESVLMRRLFWTRFDSAFVKR